ncbi:hypothetical protein F5887DRAFT_969621 [Amanita rubescens]|nr:hypothetical protein F5887DRAFT_969621 [Amanita rubescens]
MSNQQNFVRRATTECFDFSAWNGALNVPLEEPTFNFDVETSASGAPLFPDFVHYGPQETQMGGNSLDNDAYSVPWPPMNSGRYTPRCDPISNESLVNKVTEMLHNMRIFYHENLCAIEELLHKTGDLQRRTDSTTTLPLPLSHRFRDTTFNDVDLDKLWPTDYELQPSTPGSPRAGPSHDNSWVTRASSTHGDVSMDSGCIIASQHPTFTAIKGHGAKRFLCSCGHKTKTKGDMERHHETLRHAEPKYTCSCGVSYTRGDGLKRHQKKFKCGT